MDELSSGRTEYFNHPGVGIVAWDSTSSTVLLEPDDGGRNFTTVDEAREWLASAPTPASMREIKPIP